MIAIIIPVYNASKFIKKTVQSIRNQTYQDWVLICVDDGSTDNSLNLLKEFEQKDTRITVLSQKNSGAEAARKRGVMCDKAQNCEYIMFCDADDLLPDYALERMYQVARENHSDLVCGDMDKLYRNVRFPNRFHAPCFQITEPRSYNKETIQNELLISFYGISDFPVSLWAKLFKTEVITQAIEGERIVAYMGEDLCVTLRAMLQIDSCTIIPDVVYHYRIGGGSNRYNENYMRDFIALYHYKKELAEQLSIPQDWEYYLNVELLNTTKSFFQLCMGDKSILGQRLRAIIETVCSNPTVIEAATAIHSGKPEEVYAGYFVSQDYDRVISYNEEIFRKNRVRQLIKKTLFLLQ